LELLRCCNKEIELLLKSTDAPVAIFARFIGGRFRVDIQDNIKPAQSSP
jgi:hypothetical protein